MRDIKFRAYSERDKKMYAVCGFVRSYPQGYATIDTENHGRKYPGEYGDGTFHIMQFTGLLDRNGKEIYEGDILCIDHPEVKPIPKELLDGMGGAVIHPALIDGRAAYTSKIVVQIPGIYQYDFDTREYYIGGNIYENPELLS